MPHSRRKLLMIGTAIVVAVGGALAIGYNERHRIKGQVMQIQAHREPTPMAEFPYIDTASLSPIQQKLLAQLKAEYALHPVSFDQNVLKYTDGVQEPWCADFVSWNMRELGQPFVNPSSGGWRIPGVYTLREYYQSKDRWRQSGAYIPQFGDVAVYAKSPSQSHTNIVLTVDTTNHTMLTIGGNEEGHIKIKTKSYLPPHEDIAGFGALE